MGLTRQQRRYQPRSVGFVSIDPDRTTVAGLLEIARKAGYGTLYTLGPAPGVEALRKMVAEDPGAGWTDTGHFLTLPTPVLRFRYLDGQRVEIHRAASYFGDGDYTPAQAHTAWTALGALVRGAFNEGFVLTTPASTGRYLLARSISGDREWPVLEPATQDFIRATTGQGRVQMFPRGDRAASAPLVQYDGRLAYGALCGQLPAGEPTRDTIDNYAGWRTPARYCVRFRVPDHWNDSCTCGAHGHSGIGILPARAADRWLWPAEPGSDHGPAWVDGRELALALAHGWRVQIVERMIFPAPPYEPAARTNGQVSRRGPLDAWAEKLCRLRRTADNGDTHADLVNVALRSILLFGIGALHGAPRRVTHTISAAAARAGEIPATATDVLPLSDRFVWTDREPARWPEMSHPEWTSAIWARARVALLDCAQPGGRRAGMLHVPAHAVVGCFTDSVYLTADPEWSDDGRVGRLRRVWKSPHDVPTPSTAAALRRLKATGK